MNCTSPIPNIFQIDAITKMAIPSSELLMLNHQIASLTSEVSQLEIQLLGAKNLLHSLKKRSRELQICKFVDAGKVTHIGRGKNRQVTENSHRISLTKSDTRQIDGTKIQQYLSDLPEAERYKMLMEAAGLLNG